MLGRLAFLERSVRIKHLFEVYKLVLNLYSIVLYIAFWNFRFVKLWEMSDYLDFANQHQRGMVWLMISGTRVLPIIIWCVLNKCGVYTVVYINTIKITTSLVCLQVLYFVTLHHQPTTIGSRLDAYHKRWYARLLWEITCLGIEPRIINLSNNKLSVKPNESVIRQFDFKSSVWPRKML